MRRDASATLPGRGAGGQELAAGTGFGRFVILQAVGRGGMGEVYAAYDPSLDRKIALKLLRARPADGPSASDGNALLAREARAMAQLSHPNVVTVFEAGAVGDQVYLAMELIHGRTLRQWQRDGARGWRQVLEVYRMAGAGLAAAHAAGLVHRDFKPDNVLLSHEGVARVTDFGLARPLDSARGEDDAKASPFASEEGLTRPGMVPGTPAYIAPERLRGSPADARSDQFSFCVALYEALYGQPPGPVNAAPVPSGAGVPAWVQRALVRGLAEDPLARWPSMEALLTALGQDPRPRWRRVVLAAAAVGLAVATVVVGRWYAARGERRCRDAGLPIASVWDGARKDAVHRAFLASAKPYAERTWREVERTLDGYAAAWARSALEACEATHVARTQTAQELDLRMLCLSRRRTELAALVDVFEDADAQVMEKAVGAASTLRPLSLCQDAVALRSSAGVPEEPALRQAVADARAKLARSRALELSGRFKEGLEVAVQVQAEAQAIGYRPLQAEALLQEGLMRSLAGDRPKAEALLRRAALEAMAARQDEVAAIAWTRLIGTLVNLNRLPEARMADALAVAAVEQLAGQPAHDELEAALEGARPSLLVDEPEQALAHLRRALALQERLSGPKHLRVAQLQLSIATSLRVLNRLEEGRESARRSLALREELLGQLHPSVATAHLELAWIAEALGDFSGEERHLQAALAIAEKLGSSQTRPLSALADLRRRQGRYAEAHGLQQTLLREAERTLGPGHLEAGKRWVAMAVNEADWGHLDDALAHAARGVAVVRREAAGGTALTLVELAYANILGRRGEAAAAQPLLRSCLARTERSAAEQPYELTLALVSVGVNELRLGQPEVAGQRLERAHALLQQGKQSPAVLAQVDFYRARARWEAGRDVDAALGIAKDAYAQLRQYNPADAELRPMAEWLKRRRAL